jgi:hypothetical protein
MQILDHGRVAALGSCILILEDLGSGAGVSTEEHQKIVFQIVPDLLVDRERRCIDGAVATKCETRQTPKRRDVLVLSANRLAQQVDFDVACLLGKLARMNNVSGVRVQGP